MFTTTRISLFLSFLIAVPTLSIIVPCTSIKEVADFYQKNIDKKITYVTDLDDVVVKRIFIDMPRTTWWAKMIYLSLTWRILRHPIKTIYDNFHYLQRVEPMEPDTLNFIATLQKQKAPLIVLTARPIGLANKTEDQLRDIQLDFSVNNSHLTDDQKIGQEAVYRKGIIYCGTQDKGQTLTQFFKQNNIQPHDMIYVEDKESLAKSVDNAMAAANIPCTTFLYAQ